MRRRRGLPLAAAFVLAAASVLVARVGGPEGFPHHDHARLFPLCIGCHEGIPVGDAAESFPHPSICVNCHDGTRAQRVDWTGPAPYASNLRFSHPAHAAVAAGEDALPECATCHTPEGAGWMVVERAAPDRCFACHAHPAREHLVDARCVVCHVPLAETDFSLARMEALPEPSTHATPEFLATAHGRLAMVEAQSCATCHVRDQCAGCHVDAVRVSEIAALPGAPAGMRVPAIRPAYPLPPSHRDPGWIENHGVEASAATCGTCHARESCATCHAPDPPRALIATIRDLPPRAESTAPGVATGRTAPSSHASPFFATQHGTVAATRPESCANCHSQTRFCQACHLSPVAGAPPARVRRSGGASAGTGAALLELAAGLDAGVRARLAAADTPRVAQPPRRPRPPASFHPANYTHRHAAEAYNRRLDCASCHDTRVFCRDCHRQAGFGSEGRLNRGYHDAEPVWLLRHGQAARQALESCASCHGQRDCMQCHSEVGAFRINPHGAGFDAARAQRRNPRVCFACHLADPLEREAP